MTISVKQAGLLEVSSDLLVVSVFQGGAAWSGTAQTVNKALDGLLQEYAKREGFEGRLGEWLVLPVFGKMKAKKVALIGLGERSAFDLDTVRKVGGWITKRGREAKAKTVTTTLPAVTVAGVSTRDIASALVEGVDLAAYHFHTYKSKPKKETDIREVVICEEDRAKVATASRGLEEALVLAHATRLARDLVNTPSADMTPADMVKAAASLVLPRSHLSIKILDTEKMKKLGMQAALAVGRGSMHPPVGAHLVYRPSGKTKKKIVVVGKAVTFDSGGLSIKPADGMMTMKIDMAGAATVIGLFQVLPKLAPQVEVHGIFLAVENMPSGHAYRPGDVVKAMNGTTIEVLNTDAEGRVTLADALSYAATLKPDVIIDLATLTGACVVALGEEVAGLMSNDRKLTERLLQAAQLTGEPLWELPLFQPYQELIKSKVGDIKNIGGRAGGAITAGLFLSHFVENIPWAHLDIAGPSYAEKETRPDVPFGGTGYGVRLLARYLQALG